MSVNIKKGDTVKVIAGKDKGAEGKVIQVLREEQRVIVLSIMQRELGVMVLAAVVMTVLLARAAARRSQTAVRLAIGASRRQIVLQALVESVLLAIGGGIAGLAVAIGAAKLLLALAFANVSFLPISVWPSPLVLTFAFGVALLTGIVFGAVPWVVPVVFTATVKLPLTETKGTLTATVPLSVPKIPLPVPPVPAPSTVKLPWPPLSVTKLVDPVPRLRLTLYAVRTSELVPCWKVKSPLRLWLPTVRVTPVPRASLRAWRSGVSQSRPGAGSRSGVEHSGQ